MYNSFETSHYELGIHADNKANYYALPTTQQTVQIVCLDDSCFAKIIFIRRQYFLEVFDGSNPSEPAFLIKIQLDSTVNWMRVNGAIPENLYDPSIANTQFRAAHGIPMEHSPIEVFEPTWTHFFPLLEFSTDISDDGSMAIVGASENRPSRLYSLFDATVIKEFSPPSAESGNNLGSSPGVGFADNDDAVMIAWKEGYAETHRRMRPWGLAVTLDTSGVLTKLINSSSLEKGNEELAAFMEKQKNTRSEISLKPGDSARVLSLATFTNQETLNVTSSSRLMVDHPEYVEISGSLLRIKPDAFKASIVLTSVYEEPGEAEPLLATLTFNIDAPEPPVGNLIVNIEPGGARLDGAQWSIDTGGSWHDSGTSLTVIAGSKTVEFKETSGWMSPIPLNVTVFENQTSILKAIYVKTAMFENLRDILLGKTSDPSGMDLNMDGKIDVADLVYLMQTGE